MARTCCRRPGGLPVSGTSQRILGTCGRSNPSSIRHPTRRTYPIMTALRGFTLSQHSYESDENVVPVRTVPHSYHCPAGHVVTLRFAHDAEEIPTTWDCPKCGRTAHADETAAHNEANAAGN